MKEDHEKHFTFFNANSGGVGLILTEFDFEKSRLMFELCIIRGDSARSLRHDELRNYHYDTIMNFVVENMMS